MTQLDRDQAEDTYLATVSAKEAAEIRATVAWIAYDTGLDAIERAASCRAWLDAVGAVDLAEGDCAEAFALWQDQERELVTT
jgi:hypothetical protein